MQKPKTISFKPSFKPNIDKEAHDKLEEKEDTVKAPEEEEEKIKGEYSDFIGIYRDAVSEELCNEIINAFDHFMHNGSIGAKPYCEDDQFANSCAGRFDYAIELGDMTTKMDGRTDRDLNDILFGNYAEYCLIFGHLKGAQFYSSCQKVQMTPPGGGYHVWHDENTGGDYSRVAVWMVYLNDAFDGGETEFLYYKKRIQPKAGTLLIWPAGLTHCHKGNMVLGSSKNNKYIVTGWFNTLDDVPTLSHNGDSSFDD